MSRSSGRSSEPPAGPGVGPPRLDGRSRLLPPATSPRCGAGATVSRTIVSPVASRPANRMADFTWALAIDGVHSIPCRCPPATTSGGRWVGLGPRRSPHRGQRLGDPVHRAAPERVVAGERGRPGQAGHDPGQQAHAGARVGAVDLPGLVQAVATALDHDGAPAVLDRRTERRHRGGGPHHVVAVGQPSHGARAIRQCRDEQGPVRESTCLRGAERTGELSPTGDVTVSVRCASVMTGRSPCRCGRDRRWPAGAPRPRLPRRRA